MNAPVVLFAYNRVDNVEKTLSALAENKLAKESELYIFSDGPKIENDKKVLDVRKLIHDEKWNSHFKKVTIIEAEKNQGLANSIIAGVDKIINRFGKTIVIEDDCISSPDFLSFMNDCLSYYENDSKIWSIGGYTVDIDFPDDYKFDVYLMGRTCSYAWATWIDRWQKVDWDVADYSQFKFNLKKRCEFNMYGMDRSKMLDEQQLGMKNSWAIRFCYAMFRNNMFTVYPVITRIRNIGYSEGTHVTKNSSGAELFDVKLSDGNKPYELTHNLVVERKIKSQFVNHFKRNKIKLLIAYIANVLLKIKRK